MSQPICAIVDAYAGGSFLAPEFMKRGYSCIHIQSYAEMGDYELKSYRPEDFIANIVGDYEHPKKTIEALHSYDVRFVIAGSETAVDLADLLSERMGLLTNGTRMSEARRNKYFMAEAVKKRGLQISRQMKTKDPKTAVNWMKKERLSSVVVKPLNSAGTDGVFLCNRSTDIERVFRTLLGIRNFLGRKNNELLVQEVVHGVEHVVNFVSCEGTHQVTDIWRYKKGTINNAPFVYEYSELLPFEGDQEQQMVEYMRGVASALEIKTGPSHGEVFLTNDGPLLGEIGVRPDGAQNPELNRRCIGFSQIDAIVDSYLDRDRFRTRFERPYSLKEHARLVFLISKMEGTVRAIPGLAEIEKLPSYVSHQLKIKLGDSVSKTRTLGTSPGTVTLIHKDPDVLENDYNELRTIEERGLFEFS